MQWWCSYCLFVMRMVIQTVQGHQNTVSDCRASCNLKGGLASNKLARICANGYHHPGMLLWAFDFTAHVHPRPPHSESLKLRGRILSLPRIHRSFFPSLGAHMDVAMDMCVPHQMILVFHCIPDGGTTASQDSRQSLLSTGKRTRCS